MDAGLQTTIGVILMACIIACLIYWFFPTGTGQYPHLAFPHFLDVFGLGAQPDAPIVPQVGPEIGPASASIPTPTPEPEKKPEKSSKSKCSSCEMRCQSDKECPVGLGCVDGLCRCRSGLGGVCRQPSDCDCRLGIKCSLPERKCVPSNFYFDFGEASDDCPYGVRRGQFYDPFLLMSDGTQGDFQQGYHCT